MTRSAHEIGTDAMRTEAYAWIVRMHGPEAGASADAFQAWLDTDPARVSIYRDLQAHWDRAKFLTHTKTGEARDLASVAVWYRRPVPRRVAVACVALFVIAVSLAALRVAPGPSTTPMVAYATRTGEIRTVALADGSSVTLDAASKMQVSINDATREVRLVDGSARFNVKPGLSRTFAVVTGRGTVSTSGGLFDVTATAGLVRVTPLKGTLSFTGQPVAPGRGSPAAFAMNPGQRLSLGGRRPAELGRAPQTASRDWTTGMLAFDGERLADAVVEFNRHNARRIVLTDGSLADLRITGAFHADDPDGFARTVAGMFGLAWRDGDSGAIELTRKK